MGTIADTTAAWSITCAGKGVGSAQSPSRPSDHSAEALADALGSATAVAVIERTDEPAAHDNPLTREVKAALADRAADGARIPRVVSASAGLGSRDVTAGDVLAVFDWLADADAMRERPTWCSAFGIRPPSRASRWPSGHSCIQPARTFDRRVRVGHHQSAGRIARRRALQPSRPGLSALWVREEGAADHLLPHHRRRADPPARRAGDGRHGGDLRRRSLPPGSTAARPGRRRDALRGNGDQRRGGVWAALPAEARAEILARRISVWSLDTAGLARAHAPRPTWRFACGAWPWPASSSACRRSRHVPAWIAMPCWLPWRSPGTLLRQARPARGGGQPAGDQRRVRRRAERDRGDRGGPSAGPLRDAIVGGHHMTAEPGLGAERR